MKKIVSALLVLGFAWASFAADKAQLEVKAMKLVAKFDAMQQKSDKRIPPDVLKKAYGIILMDRTKAGFVFAYQGGGGIAMAKDKSGHWGPIAFMSANEASVGFQVGGQQSFLVFLMMNKETATRLGESTFEFGGEARGTAGDTSAGEEGTVQSEERPMLIYDDRQGLFGGAAVKGGALAPDENANTAYYGDYLTIKEILFGKKVKPTKAAERFAEKIADYSKSK